MRSIMYERAGLITASLAGLSWIDQIDLLLRWGAAGIAIAVGIVSLYQRLKK